MPHDKARIWFFTDIHGSDACFRKFLRTLENPNKPNVLIIGGDITGKQVVPLVADKDGIVVPLHGKQCRFPTSRLAELNKELADCGLYPFECDEQGYKQFSFDEQTRNEVFERLVKERLAAWVAKADAVLPSAEHCQVFVNAGNDDPPFVDAILDGSNRIRRPEGKVFDLPCGLRLISTGYSNPTPWKCPRDIEEDALTAKIAAMTGQLSTNDLKKAVFNFHCPPKDTALDLAPRIDPKTLRPLAGFKGAQKVHVGSTAVRHAIEVWNPLVGLHGHVHGISAKDNVNGTPCFNPGTDYHTGHLQGVYIQVTQSGVIEFDQITYERDPKLNDSSKQPHTLESLLMNIPIFGSLYKALKGESTREDEILNKLNALQKDVASLTQKQGQQPPPAEPRV